MNKFLIGGGLAVVMVAMVVAFWPAPANAMGATVFNKPDGFTCGINPSPNLYMGTPTVVITPSGNVHFSCDASLVSGPGVSSGTVTSGVPGPLGTTCRVVETPSGNASASCH